MTRRFARLYSDGSMNVDSGEVVAWTYPTKLATIKEKGE